MWCVLVWSPGGVGIRKTPSATRVEKTWRCAGSEDTAVVYRIGLRVGEIDGLFLSQITSTFETFDRWMLEL